MLENCAIGIFDLLSGDDSLARDQLSVVPLLHLSPPGEKASRLSSEERTSSCKKGCDVSGPCTLIMLEAKIRRDR